MVKLQFGAATGGKCAGGGIAAGAAIAGAPKNIDASPRGAPMVVDIRVLCARRVGEAARGPLYMGTGKLGVIPEKNGSNLTGLDGERDLRAPDVSSTGGNPAPAPPDIISTSYIDDTRGDCHGSSLTGDADLGERVRRNIDGGGIKKPGSCCSESM